MNLCYRIYQQFEYKSTVQALQGVQKKKGDKNGREHNFKIGKATTIKCSSTESPFSGQ